MLFIQPFRDNAHQVLEVLKPFFSGCGNTANIATCCWTKFVESLEWLMQFCLSSFGCDHGFRGWPCWKGELFFLKEFDAEVYDKGVEQPAEYKSLL